MPKVIEKSKLDRWLISEDSNVFTFRITPHSVYSSEQIEELFKSFQNNHINGEPIKRFMCFREYTKIGNVLHYHCRIEVNVCKNTLKKYFHDHFPKIKEHVEKQIENYIIIEANTITKKNLEVNIEKSITQQQETAIRNKAIKKFNLNKYTFFKECYINGVKKQKKELWRTRSYTAKDGDIICYKGHTLEEINECIAVGHSLKPNKSFTIHKRISFEYNIKPDISHDALLRDVVEWYDKNDKQLPLYQNLEKLLVNIKMFTDPQFKERLIQHYALKFKQSVLQI